MIQVVLFVVCRSFGNLTAHPKPMECTEYVQASGGLPAPQGLAKIVANAWYYIYTLWPGLICTPAPKGFTYKGWQSVCFCLVRCKVLLSFTLCIVWELYCMPFMQPPVLCCIILHHMQEPTRRPALFAIIRRNVVASLCGGTSTAFRCLVCRPPIPQ